MSNTVTDQFTYYTAAIEGKADVIHHLLNSQLRAALYKVYLSTGLPDSYEFRDSIDDFFLFLYNGPAYLEKAGMPPFSIIARISDINSLYAWIISTYRLFLLQQLPDIIRMKRLEDSDTVCYVNIPEQETAGPAITGNENTINDICDSIAFCYCNNTPVGRFILLRWLMTALERHRAIRQEPMAETLGLKNVTYRVKNARQKQRIGRTLRNRKSGKLNMSKAQTEMSRHLAGEFDNLYDCLAGYYDACVASLPQANDIQELRTRLSKDQDRLLHDTGQ